MLILMESVQLVIKQEGKAVTDSLKIAEVFGKRHADVIRSIKSLECSEEFRERNFALSSYFSKQNKEMPKCYITQDGFSLSWATQVRMLLCLRRVISESLIVCVIGLSIHEG